MKKTLAKAKKFKEFGLNASHLFKTEKNVAERPSPAIGNCVPDAA